MIFFEDVIPMRLAEGAKMPFKKYMTDAGWDLFVSRDITVNPNEIVDVHTDVYTNIPPGLYGRITGRSSTLRKHRCHVNEGVIDSGFTGELFICVENVGTEPFYIKKGMRLAQIIFGRIAPVMLVQVSEKNMPIGVRGDSGFGSTGI